MKINEERAWKIIYAARAVLLLIAGMLLRWEFKGFTVEAVTGAFCFAFGFMDIVWIRYKRP